MRIRAFTAWLILTTVFRAARAQPEQGTCYEVQTDFAVNNIQYTKSVGPSRTTFNFVLTPAPGTSYFAIRVNNAFASNPELILAANPEGNFQSTSTAEGGPQYIWPVNGTTSQSFSITVPGGEDYDSPVPTLTDLCQQNIEGVGVNGSITYQEPRYIDDSVGSCVVFLGSDGTCSVGTIVDKEGYTTQILPTAFLEVSPGAAPAVSPSVPVPPETLPPSIAVAAEPPTVPPQISVPGPLTPIVSPPLQPPEELQTSSADAPAEFQAPQIPPDSRPPATDSPIQPPQTLASSPAAVAEPPQIQPFAGESPQAASPIASPQGSVPFTAAGPDFSSPASGQPPEGSPPLPAGPLPDSAATVPEGPTSTPTEAASPPTGTATPTPTASPTSQPPSETPAAATGTPTPSVPPPVEPPTGSPVTPTPTPTSSPTTQPPSETPTAVTGSPPPGVPPPVEPPATETATTVTPTATPNAAEGTAVPPGPEETPGSSVSAEPTPPTGSETSTPTSQPPQPENTVSAVPGGGDSGSAGGPSSGAGNQTPAPVTGATPTPTPTPTVAGSQPTPSPPAETSGPTTAGQASEGPPVPSGQSSSCQVFSSISTSWDANGESLSSLNLYLQNSGATAISLPLQVTISNPSWTDFRSPWNLQVSSVSGGTISATASPESTGNLSLLPYNANTANVGGIIVHASDSVQGPSSITINGISCSVTT